METLASQPLNIVDKALKKAYEFDFHQLLYVLEQSQAGSSKSKFSLKIRPDTSLAFPAADIKRLSETNDQFELIVRFMGLYGVDSPLPQYFIEDIDAVASSNNALQAFLDIFNQKLYNLLHQGWLKGQFFRNDKHDNYTTMLRNIGALNWQDKSSDQVGGSFLGAKRNLSSLESLLKARFPLVDLKIDANAVSWVDLQETPILNGHFELGGDTLLGGRLAVSGQKIIVNLGVLPEESAYHFFAGGKYGTSLARMVKQFLPDTCIFDINMTVEFGAAKDWCLGGDNSSLAMHTILGQKLDQQTLVLNEKQFNLSDMDEVA
ncbi:type VI secretion system baseplate subunit TssG [Reinekea sp.]|uniref:type VI secretion system baseplate subunit TssG n=1 Tax=Reinekea sp. TaxID=1970455 RepID=UPI0039891F5B